MKAQNLGAVVANYRAAGARCVIVSGVAGPGRGLHAGMVPRAAFTVCRLGVGRAELKQRFLGRGGRADMAEEVLRIDTDRLTVEEAADVIAARTGWPGQPGRQTRDAAGGLG